jgi:hypothetical protein
MGNRWGKGIGDGEGKEGGEVSTQATWDQSGRESHHNAKEGFQVSKRGREQGRDFPGKGGLSRGSCMYLRYNANLVHIVPIVCVCVVLIKNCV